MLRLLLPAACALVTAAPALAVERVYASDLKAGAGPEWSDRHVDQTPNLSRKFLGPGLNDPITLSLKNLPADHAYVRISFDLLILLSWDGNAQKTDAGDVVGPDGWRLSLDDGRTLLWHTFSNTPRVRGFSNACTFQSYPSPVAGAMCLANTGAAEVNTLGYVMRAGPGFPMDAVYHISLLVPHTAGDIGVDFRGYGLQPPSPKTGRMDEGWGLDRVTVETLTAAEVTPPTADEAKALLDQAAGPPEGDPVRANEAYVALLAGGPGVQQACAGALAAAGWDAKLARRFEKSIATGADPLVREWASKELQHFGAIAEGSYWRLARDSNPPAVRTAAVAALRDMEPVGLNPATRRAAVASRVLTATGQGDDVSRQPTSKP
jgi:hypothetical protein